MTDTAPKWFAPQLLRWDKAHNLRKFIWQEEKNPYKVWVREILLQQTRVGQALNYYQRFLSVFPSIHELASAPEQQIFKVWEGIGYYNRCRNMIQTAEHIVDNYDGRFPNSYKGLLALKGIGTYTAAAIMSFCYNAPYAVVDGNVERIVTRYLGYTHNIRISKHKKAVEQLALNMLSKKKSAVYNQAIMDFGATICTPSLPNCTNCFAASRCVAFKKDIVSTLPHKAQVRKIKEVYWIFLFITDGKKIAIQEKTTNQLWKQLSLLPTIAFENLQQLESNTCILKNIPLPYQNTKGITISPATYSQTLSHRKVYARFVEITISPKLGRSLPNIHPWITKKQLKHHSFPVIIRKYLEKVNSRTR